jgi:UDP-N-acetylglucosamine acyltransferase
MMAAEIHPTAVVDPSAELADGVVIGPYAIVEAGVRIGAGTVVGPFCRLTGAVVVGARNCFESHCSIGAPPQDLKFAGEDTRLEIGDGNVFREFVTFHRGTRGGGGVTRVGDRNLFMAYAHIAHDCYVGSETILANNATLAGHVEVGDFATIGAFSAVHQFCHVGRFAFIGGGSICTKDVLPFMKTVGSRPARCFGPNSIGLQRRGFSDESRTALKQLWRHLHNPKLNTSQALERIAAELAGQAEVDEVVGFMAASERGVILANG